MSDVEKAAPRLVLGETWVMNTFEGRQYMGHVSAIRTVGAWVQSPSDGGEEMMRDYAQRVLALEPGDVFRLNPCYEVNIGEQMTATGPALGAVTLPFALFGFARPVTMRAGVLAFLAELEQSDFRMAKDWVRAAEEARTRVRAQRAGIRAPR